MTRLHDGSGRTVADHGASMLDLNDPGEELGRGAGIAVDEYEEFACVGGADGFDRLRLAVFTGDAIPELHFMIEDVSKRVFKDVDGPAGVAAKIQHESFVLSRLGEDRCDRILGDVEVRHLPDEGVTVLKDTFTVKVSIFLVLAYEVPKVVAGPTASDVENGLAGTNRRADDFLSALAGGRCEIQLLGGCGREHLEEVLHISKVGAPEIETIKHEDFITYMEPGSGVRAWTDAGDKALVADHLHMKAGGRSIDARRRHKEGMGVLQASEEGRDDTK